MPCTPNLHLPTAPYRTSDQTSFAYVSARDRWPVILTQAIDDVFRTTRDHTDPEKIAEGKRIVEKLAKLKYEVQHDRVLSYVFDAGPWMGGGRTDDGTGRLRMMARRM